MEAKIYVNNNQKNFIYISLFNTSNNKQLKK